VFSFYFLIFIITSMKAFVVLLLCSIFLFSFAFATSEQQYEDAFSSWMQQHKKVYANDQEAEHRFESFKWNYDFVHNWDAKTKGFQIGLNKFADLNSQEFTSQFNGMRVRKTYTKPTEVSTVGLPASVDWNAAGFVTPIKNQGQCGGCWSFSATGSLESAIAIAINSAPVGLSEQNLLDCSGSYGNQGCNGGLMDDAFEYIINNQGIDTEASYPYEAQDNSQCYYLSADSAGYCTGYTDVTSGSESALQVAVAQQPTSVAIDAGLPSFQLYTSGVYYEPACSSTALDHGVLAVGYGVDGSSDYWEVKNSWGTDWGMSGYIWMARNENNNCGIATDASYPTGATQSNGGTSNTGSVSEGGAAAASSGNGNSDTDSSTGSSGLLSAVY